MAGLDYGAIVYKNGKRVQIPELKYYYNKKQKAYVGADINETTEDMYEAFLKQNGNLKTPGPGLIIPIGNRCLVFYKTLPPRLFINGNEGKLCEIGNDKYKEMRGELVLTSFFDYEFEDQIKGYEFTYKDDSYLVIYGYLVNEYDRKHLIKMFDKRIIFEAEPIPTIHYGFDSSDCDYDLLIDYTVRKDEKRMTRKRIFKLIRTSLDFEEIKKELKYWWMLH